MTLNKTWKNCLRMWKWIDKVWDSKTGNVEKLKSEWLCKHMPGIYINSNCFFCRHQVQKGNIGDCNCQSCPGKLVNKRFDCRNTTYHYKLKPKKFYQRLLQLDAKRRQK